MSLRLFPLVAFLALTAQAATIIDTTPSTSSISSFGYPDTATYGQTITAPLLDSTLTSFSFLMNLPSSTTFRGYVFDWDGSKAAGTALWTGPVTATSGTGMEQVNFNTGGIALTGGSQYVIFASVTGLAGTGQGPWGSRNDGDVYAGGAFVFINNEQDPGAWTASEWSTNWQGSGYDLAFIANFSEGSAVPEPATFALLAAGLGWIAIRRRK